MAVVKSDGYGHGMIPAARGGAGRGRHLARRRARRRGHGAAPGRRDRARAVPARHARRAARGGHPPRRRPDRGLGRPGPPDRGRRRARGRPGRGCTWRPTPGCPAAARPPRTGPAWCDAALAAQAAGQVRIAGLWSHLACADIPGHPVDRRASSRRSGTRSSVAERAGSPAGGAAPREHGRHAEPAGEPIRPGPAGRRDLRAVPRCPAARPDWLRPAMTRRARLVQVKRVPARDAGVSYGHRYITAAGRHARAGAARLRRGVPRQATNTGGLLVRGRRCDDLRHGLHEPVRDGLRGRARRGRR